MIHLLSKYGEFESLGINHPLNNFMGSRGCYNGVKVSGYSPIFENENGEPYWVRSEPCFCNDGEEYADFQCTLPNVQTNRVSRSRSGLEDGWYDVTHPEYGASCDFPFKKYWPGTTKPRPDCCVHAYTSQDECDVDIAARGVDVMQGLHTVEDDSENEEIIMPWQELSCPLEITIDDSRSPGMSLKQQFDSISVSASRLVSFLFLFLFFCV